MKVNAFRRSLRPVVLGGFGVVTAACMVTACAPRDHTASGEGVPASECEFRKIPNPESPIDVVRVLDESIQRKVKVVAEQTERTKVGGTRAHMIVRNCTDYKLTLEARTRFLDDEGIPIEPSTSWSVIHIQPHARKHYSAVSLSQEYSPHYLVELREIRG